jgi:hypothetical protein
MGMFFCQGDVFCVFKKVATGCKLAALYPGSYKNVKNIQ